MARVGFKTTLPSSNLDKAAVLSLFNKIKTLVIDAGFTILLDTANAVDFIRMGSPAGTANDDVPHWAFEYVDRGTESDLLFYPVYGNNYLDPAAYAHSLMVTSSGWYSSIASELTIWFAADGAAGWWWLHSTKVNVDSPTGVSMDFGYAGVTSRRYPSDTYQGLCARYGIWNVQGSWESAYVTDPSGSVNAHAYAATWSPLGLGWSHHGVSHPGSPLPRMAVPQFPARSGGDTACILGEFNEILILTDGYTAEEIVVPGWIAMIGDNYQQPYAVPAPASFTLL